jgi:hypothetical protein
MTSISSPDCNDLPPAAARMRAIATNLNAAGLQAAVHKAGGAADVTATLHQLSGKAIEIIADDDGYVQVSYWNPDDASPDQVTAVITRVIAAITGGSYQ